MADLKTKYLGLELKNPVIAGACNLWDEVNNLQKVEKAGASAIVYRSLFEEQIQLESLELQHEMEEFNERHAEMVKLFPEIEHSGTEEFLIKLKKAKNSVSIPVIASLNAVYRENWLEFSKEIENTGVDAIELNFYAVPKMNTIDGKDIIAEQLAIAEEVKKSLKIPVSVKLSPFYTNILNFITKLDQRKIDGIVLFNRLFQPDIDTDKEEHFQPYYLSNHEDNRLPLRYVGLLYGKINASICSNTGIFSGNDVVKMLLAGSDCVQVVSTLYKNKIENVSKILDELENWMEKHNYSSINEFKGKLSQPNTKEPFIYKRAQYVDYMMKSNNIFNKFPIV